MKCGNIGLRIEVRALQQGGHPIAHLAGGFIGESHRQDGRWRHMARRNDMGDSVRNDARFSAASAGQYQQWAFGVSYGLTLLRVQPLKEIHERDSFECSMRPVHTTPFISNLYLVINRRIQQRMWISPLPHTVWRPTPVQRPARSHGRNSASAPWYTASPVKPPSG